MQVDFVGLSEIIRDGSEVPTHPYLWIWGMTAPRLISGSHKVQTFIKKIIVPNFPYLPHCHFCPEKGPGWLVKLYFCIHWMSVLHCCCGAFPGAGIGWASGGEDFWKIFPLCWTSDVKDHWSWGERAYCSMNVLPLASAEAGWDPACKCLKASNLTGPVAW